MADINKRVVIEGDAGGLEQTMQEVQNSGNALYRSLKNEAMNYSDSLKDQAAYIEKLLNLENRRSTEIIRQNKIQIQLDRESELAKAKGNARLEEDVNKKYSNLEKQNKIEDFLNKSEISEARYSLYNDYSSRKEPVPQNIEEEANNSLNDGNLVKKGFMRAQNGARGILNSVTAGLGIGMGFGIFGILYTMVQKSAELDKVMHSLSATLDNTSMVGGRAAAAIGKSSAEMVEFTRNVAIASGGSLGKQTGTSAFQLAQYSKAFGVDQDLLLQQLGTGRMGGANINAELLDLLREMKKSGAIDKGNFSQLGEKIEYWSRLNNMQSQQMINVNPGISTAVLSAMQGTGLSILSDQRQMDFITGINQAITNPNNDFKKSFLMDALSTGDYVGTSIKMEQGIFGEGNVRKIVENLISQYGGQNNESLIIAFKSLFNTSMQQSKYIVDNLLTNPEQKEKFYGAMDSIGNLNADYENIEQRYRTGKINKQQRDKLLKENEDKYNLSSDMLKNEFGYSVGERAIRNTGLKESAIAGMNNLMAESGSPILKNLAGIIKDQNVQDALTNLVSGISYVAAKLIGEAAPILKEGAILFNKAVEFFVESTGADKYTNISKDVEAFQNSPVVPNYLKKRGQYDLRKAENIVENSKDKEEGKKKAYEFLAEEYAKLNKALDEYVENPKKFDRYVVNPDMYMDLVKALSENTKAIKDNNAQTDENTKNLKQKNNKIQDLSKPKGEEN